MKRKRKQWRTMRATRRKRGSTQRFYTFLFCLLPSISLLFFFWTQVSRAFLRVIYLLLLLFLTRYMLLWWSSTSLLFKHINIFQNFLHFKTLSIHSFIHSSSNSNPISYTNWSARQNVLRFQHLYKELILMSRSHPRWEPRPDFSWNALSLLCF